MSQGIDPGWYRETFDRVDKEPTRPDDCSNVAAEMETAYRSCPRPDRCGDRRQKIGGVNGLHDERAALGPKQPLTSTDGGGEIREANQLTDGDDRVEPSCHIRVRHRREENRTGIRIIEIQDIAAGTRHELTMATGEFVLDPDGEPTGPVGQRRRRKNHIPTLPKEIRAGDRPLRPSTGDDPVESGTYRAVTSPLPARPDFESAHLRGRTMAISRIGIVGSGIMGSGIAEVAATTGHEVVLRSRSLESAQAMVAGLEKSLARQVEKGRREQADADAALARVTATADLADLAGCDLVLESVVEDLDIKLALFRELDAICGPDTIIATNTSTLPVVEMAMVTNRPGKVCGVHFFNPAPAMSLVEIIRPITADEETIASVKAFAEACGKQAVEVADRAGFIVNALLFPYLNNAVRLLENGVASRDDIDTAMKGGCNFPMGPLALLDLVGLDTSVSILDALYDEFRDPNFAPVPRLRRMVTAGHLGRKSGQGFFDYRK